jgi:chloramphenicol 3-O-phosphotransferase
MKSARLHAERSQRLPNRRTAQHSGEVDAALARNYVAAGYVCVLEGAIVRRSQVLACQRKVAPHPLHLIVLAPPAEVSERRDADRPGKHVAAWFRHLGPVLDRELAGLGLWIDNSRQSPLNTARMILTRRPGARL